MTTLLSKVYLVRPFGLDRVPRGHHELGECSWRQDYNDGCECAA